ncbi:hypothetical protein NQ318_009170 [Aromia moschata]|uniref:Helix-turn-helix domain-containing protein n=1 Tax=Aromia moschata TaxID=1265417 RepID=A0AAV8XW31_9CUCU|nr:hypothetical protein NQ318_009170 [Aromia moschata]
MTRRSVRRAAEHLLVVSLNRLADSNIIIILSNALDHGVYRKKTHTDRYLNAASHHHPQQKRSLIKTLVHRAETICDDESRLEELQQSKEALTKNGYKEKYIDRVCRTQRTKVCLLPYVSGVTDKLKKILSKKNIGVRFRTVKKIQQVLPSNKNPVPRLLTKGVYELKCTCGKSYIGQTGRSIQCRIKEHQRHTRLGNTDIYDKILPKNN